MYTVIYSVIYVLLGNARSTQQNPFIPGANIAMNMIVPVIAGILMGYKIGGLSGFVGTIINAMITQSPFEFAAILPHTLMGIAAGMIPGQTSLLVASCAVVIGHVLNISVFLLVGLMQFINLLEAGFLLGLGLEILFDIVAIVAIVMLVRFVYIQGRTLDGTES